ncbi:fimbrial biogenesis outer membrane usher protein [Providencia sneebia DSM 19967]|uniref:Fimbrial biogenesis outer membrane usher protein n=1 Tax=Providencia sneebia DSM 19967 TaxID=1141660 RepID=K8WVV6_9GAMM|nr:fimbrial biogenesis outer membrane usher protein [Providencia sneebia DSM 19967]
MFFLKRCIGNRLFISIILIVLIPRISIAIEFNMNVIDALDRDNIDIRHFSNPNFIFPGEYLVDVTLNGNK